MLSSTQLPPDQEEPSATDASLSFVEENLPSPMRHWPWRSQPWRWALAGLTAVLLLAVIGLVLREAPHPMPPAARTTATRAAPQWVTDQQFMGTSNLQTGVFRVAAGDRILWTVAPATSPATFCRVTVYASDGTVLEVLTDTAHQNSGQQGSYEIRETDQVYLVVMLLNTAYSIAVQTPT
jgi:hypothetical protein